MSNKGRGKSGNENKVQEKPYSIFKFLELFPNNDVCLEIAFKIRYGSTDRLCIECGRVTKYRRMIKRKCYQCRHCRHNLYPLSGTVLHGSTTKLTTWFYAIYLISISKNGISALEMKTVLGVTLKTAWRIGNKIREAISKEPGEGSKFSGIIELDEALIGGKVKGGKRGWGAGNKTCLFGIKEREGRVKVIAVKNRERDTLFPIIRTNVEQGSFINTDEFKVYHTLSQEGYEHDIVVHSKYQWSKDNVHTNSIEGYWSNLKKSILGTHTFVSPQHIQKYLCEFDFRHNNRHNNTFEQLLKKILC